VVSVFLYLLQFPSYDVINDVIMSYADCNLGREPRSVAASFSDSSKTLFTRVLFFTLPGIEHYIEQ